MSWVTKWLSDLRKKMTRSFLGENMSYSSYGLVGECIAMTSILQRGYGCAMAQQDGCDLVCWDRNNIDTGNTFLVQVRSCQLSRNHKNRLHFQLGMGGTKRMPTRQDYDILALVATEQRTVFFMPVYGVNCKKLTKTPDFFSNPEIEIESWKKTIEALNGKHN